MAKPDKHNYREPVVFRNNLFGGLEMSRDVKNQKKEVSSDTSASDATQALALKSSLELEKIHRKTPKIKLSAATKFGTIAELLVVMSPRDSVISIPCAVIPDTKGDFKLFKLDYRGNPTKPYAIQHPVVNAYLDAHHLHDKYSKSGSTQWAIIQVTRRTKKKPFGSFHIHRLADNVYETTAAFYRRTELSYTGRYYSIPAFEVQSDSWYYEDLLRKLGAYMGIKQPVPTNNLRKYYQYKRMQHGAFVDMYSYLPESEEEEIPATQEPIIENLSTIETIAEEVAGIMPATPPPIQTIEDKRIKKRFALRGGAL